MTDLHTVQSLLDALPASDCTYDEWLKVGMALHEEGFSPELWDTWSAKDPGRYQPGVCREKWETFGRGGTPVTIGTLFYLAGRTGRASIRDARACDWNDWARADVRPAPSSTAALPASVSPAEAPDLPPFPENYVPENDIRDYLEALFEPEDHVCFVTSAYQDADGKWKPVGQLSGRTCRELLEAMREDPDLTDTFGTCQAEAGAWICPNPTDGTGRSNRNVRAWRFALVESDSQPLEVQYALIRSLHLPVRMLVHSGGKSLHAIVRIDASNYEEYRERVALLYETCRHFGLDVDEQNKNPSRLSRFPGFRRGDGWQYILDRDLGAPTWDAWVRCMQQEDIPPLDVVSLSDVWDNPPPLRDVLIDGVLRRSHKMILVASSKAGKTCALIELAVCIAEGLKWLGCRCAAGPVLYLNLELDSASFIHRVLKVYQAMEITNPHPDRIDIVNLRGKINRLEELIPRLMRQILQRNYAAVICDPIYKLGLGDENAASEITRFCAAMDQLANLGPAVIYAHHHSKGGQGSKSSMDRASGSGVFARDADALLDLIELEIPEEHLAEAQENFGPTVTAWRMESTLREFPRMEPVNLFFGYPLHETDELDILREAPLKENARTLKNGREIRGLQQAERKKTDLQRLRECIERDLSFAGKRKNQEDYARELNISIRTVRRYYRELGLSDTPRNAGLTPPSRQKGEPIPDVREQSV